MRGLQVLSRGAAGGSLQPFWGAESTTTCSLGVTEGALCSEAGPCLTAITLQTPRSCIFPARHMQIPHPTGHLLGLLMLLPRCLSQGPLQPHEPGSKACSCSSKSHLCPAVTINSLTSYGKVSLVGPLSEVPRTELRGFLGYVTESQKIRVGGLPHALALPWAPGAH